MVQAYQRLWLHGPACALALALAACGREDVRIELAAVTTGDVEQTTNFFDAPVEDRAPSIAKPNEPSAPFVIPPLAMPSADSNALAMAAQTKVAAAPPPPPVALTPRNAPPKAAPPKPVRIAAVGARDGGSIHRKKPDKSEPGTDKPAQPQPQPAPANPPPLMDDGKDWVDASPSPSPLPAKPVKQVARITVIDTNLVGAKSARQLIGASGGSSDQVKGSLLSANVLPKDGGLAVVAVDGKTLLGSGDALININAFQNGTPGGGVLATVVAVAAPVTAVAAPVVDTTASVVAPVVDTVAAVAAPAVTTVTAVAAPVVAPVTAVAAPVVAAAAPVVAPVVPVVAPVVAPVAPVVAPVMPVVAPVVNAIPGASGLLGGLLGKPN